MFSAAWHVWVTLTVDASLRRVRPLQSKWAADAAMTTAAVFCQRCAYQVMVPLHDLGGVSPVLALHAANHGTTAVCCACLCAGLLGCRPV